MWHASLPPTLHTRRKARAHLLPPDEWRTLSRSSLRSPAIFRFPLVTAALYRTPRSVQFLPMKACCGRGLTPPGRKKRRITGTAADK